MDENQYTGISSDQNESMILKFDEIWSKRNPAE
jgi:hypothetical protein